MNNDFIHGIYIILVYKALLFVYDAIKFGHSTNIIADKKVHSIR